MLKVALSDFPANVQAAVAVARESLAPVWGQAGERTICLVDEDRNIYTCLQLDMRKNSILAVELVCVGFRLCSPRCPEACDYTFQATEAANGPTIP